MQTLSGAEYLADILAAYRVSHVFFVPAILSRTLAELDLRTEIKRVMTHGEKSAVYMADGYARATGRPGVCFAQCIGAANLAAALREPYLACSPLVVFTGGPYSDQRHRHSYQEIDDLALFRPVTKSSVRVERIEQLPEMVRQAFRTATTGTPGPVHLELAGHLGELEEEPIAAGAAAEDRYSQIPPWRPAAQPEDVAQALTELQKAERPVIVAGGGVRHSLAGNELTHFAERLNLPVATSLNAKACVPGDHRLNVGVPGWYCRKSANQVLLESDLVFFVGSKTGSQVTFKWKVPPEGTNVIQCDINPLELGKHYPNRVSLHGDARAVLQQLTDATTEPVPARDSWLARIDALKAAWRNETAEVRETNQDPIRPERICGVLSETLPEQSLVVVETGHSGMWTAAMLDLCRRGQDFIRAAGSLGWGLPAAIGAKLASPDRPVVLFSGDGGFWYHLSEVETAVRWQVPVVLLINNNRALNQEIELYTRAYGGELRGEHGHLWKFSDASFAEISKAMGAEGIRVERCEELAGAIERGLTSNGPCVIDVVSDQYALAPLPWLSD